jgi:hypothetical protein
VHLGHNDRGWGKGGEHGTRASTQHPPLQALACRVDWVLMAMSPPVDGHPVPTPAVSLSSEVVAFHYLALADVPYAGELYLFCMTSLQFDVHSES